MVTVEGRRGDFGALRVGDCEIVGWAGEGDGEGGGRLGKSGGKAMEERNNWERKCTIMKGLGCGWGRKRAFYFFILNKRPIFAIRKRPGRRGLLATQTPQRRKIIKKKLINKKL
ncbi:MAG: hypothetical protein HUK17_07285 [Bacteroidales bacterium]|nr:hypothetical protein [Bacteroidales bacterium]